MADGDSSDQQDFDYNRESEYNIQHNRLLNAQKPPVRKFKCLTCEPPDCTEGPPCSGALQVCGIFFIFWEGICSALFVNYKYLNVLDFT